jgi:antitoxin YefM
MTIEVTYSQTREELASLLDDVTQDKEMVIINRRGGKPAALIAADELVSLTETVHLMHSPAYTECLVAALDLALKGEGQILTVDELMVEVGLDE